MGYLADAPDVAAAKPYLADAPDVAAAKPYLADAADVAAAKAEFQKYFDAAAAGTPLTPVTVPVAPVVVPKVVAPKVAAPVVSYTLPHTYYAGYHPYLNLRINAGRTQTCCKLVFVSID